MNSGLGSLADVINCAKFYLSQVRDFNSFGVEFLAFPWGVTINTWLELSFSLW